MNRPITGADSLPGILSHHLCELRASGLSDATIVAAGIRSETRVDRLAAILDWRIYPAKCSPAIVFPFFAADGSNGYCRVKPDNPRIVAKKKVKYESPRGRANEIYLRPGVAEKLNDAGQELLLTEGEKKSLKATQDGFACIGLVGVFGWKSKGDERLLPSLERITWRGRKVYIVFDSDIAANENVQDAESRLAAHLGKRGAIVRVVRLPPGPPGSDGKPTKMGLDDFLVAYGPGPLRRLLDEAQEAEPVSAVEAKQAAAALDPATEAAAMLAADAIDGVPILRFWRGEFWRWLNGRYESLDATEAKAAVIRAANRHYHHLTNTIVANVASQLSAQSQLPSRTEPPAWIGTPPVNWPPDEILATRNKLVHLPSFVGGRDCLLPATPKYFATAALDYAFDPEAPRPVAWLDFLAQLWGDDSESVATLQEWFGYCLAPDTRQQKMLLLVGPKRSGKGTIVRVLRGLVGHENTAGPTLASLATNFGLWPLLDKSVAIVNDARLSGRSD